MSLKITEINEGSTAEQAGLMINDIIISYNGIGNLFDIGQLINAVNSSIDNTGDVEIVIERNGLTEHIKTKTGKLGVSAMPNIESVDTNKPNDLNDYYYGRRIASFVSGLGWILTILSIPLLLTGMVEGSIALSLCGVACIFSGLLYVMGAQVVKAIMDNANYSRQILEELKKSN